MPVELANRHTFGYGYRMKVAEITDENIAEALRSAEFPPLFHACGFRRISVMDADATERDLVEIIVILDTDEWTEAAAKACRQTSLICADTLGPLGLLSLPICRTRAEHEEAITVEEDIWRMLDHTKPC